jgi:hypothetical protein
MVDWIARLYFLGTMASAGIGWAVTFFATSAQGWDAAAVWVASVIVGAGCAIIFIALKASKASVLQNHASPPTASIHVVQPIWWPLRDLFAYLAPYLPLRATKKTESGAFVDGVDPRWKPIGDLVLKPLSLGLLRSNGRQRRSGKRLHAAPISAEFWREAKFTYWFLDAGPSVVQDAHNDSDSFSEIEVDRSEAMAIWPNGAEIPLLDAAREIYEQIKDKPIGVVIEALNDNADDMLSWICIEIAMYKNGKEPLVKLRGNKPPSRLVEEIYTAPLTNYDFVVEGNAIILQQRFENSRYENLAVVAADMDRAIHTMGSRQV